MHYFGDEPLLRCFDFQAASEVWQNITCQQPAQSYSTRSFGDEPSPLYFGFSDAELRFRLPHQFGKAALANNQRNLVQHAILATNHRCSILILTPPNAISGCLIITPIPHHARIPFPIHPLSRRVVPWHHRQFQAACCWGVVALGGGVVGIINMGGLQRETPSPCPISGCLCARLCAGGRGVWHGAHAKCA